MSLDWGTVNASGSEWWAPGVVAGTWMPGNYPHPDFYLVFMQAAAHATVDGETLTDLAGSSTTYPFKSPQLLNRRSVVGVGASLFPGYYLALGQFESPPVPPIYADSDLSGVFNSSPWTPSAEVGNLIGLARGKAVHLAVGVDGFEWITDTFGETDYEPVFDGATSWTTIDAGLASERAVAACWNGPYYFVLFDKAKGSSPPTPWGSTNCARYNLSTETWDLVSLPSTFADGFDAWHEIAAAPDGRVVAITRGGRVCYSSNHGATFGTATLPGDAYSLRYVRDRFVVLCDLSNGEAYESAAGDTWASSGLPAAPLDTFGDQTSWETIVVGPDRAFAVATDGATSVYEYPDSGYLPLALNSEITGIYSAYQDRKLYRLDVPPTAAFPVTVTLTPTDESAGDADIYARLDLPVDYVNNDYDDGSWNIGNEESYEITEAGAYYLLIDAYESFSGVTLAAYEAGDPEPPEPSIFWTGFVNCKEVVV